MPWLLSGCADSRYDAGARGSASTGNIFHYIAELPARFAMEGRELGNLVLEMFEGGEGVDAMMNMSKPYGCTESLSTMRCEEPEGEGPPTPMSRLTGMWKGDNFDRNFAKYQYGANAIEKAFALGNLSTATWFMANGADLSCSQTMFGRGSFYSGETTKKERKEMLDGMMELWKRKHGVKCDPEIELSKAYKVLSETAQRVEQFLDDGDNVGTTDHDMILAMTLPKVAVKTVCLMKKEKGKGEKWEQWKELFEAFDKAAKEGFKRLDNREMVLERGGGGGVKEFLKLMKQTFDDLDEDHSGSLDVDELKKGLEVLNEGQTFSTTQCQAMVDKYVPSGRTGEPRCQSPSRPASPRAALQVPEPPCQSPSRPASPRAALPVPEPPCQSPHLSHT
jgi:hypothetical protein